MPIYVRELRRAPLSRHNPRRPPPAPTNLPTPSGIRRPVSAASCYNNGSSKWTGFSCLARAAWQDTHPSELILLSKPLATRAAVHGHLPEVTTPHTLNVPRKHCGDTLGAFSI